MNKQGIEQSIEKLEVGQDDFILLRGEWHEIEIHYLAKMLESKKKANIIVLLNSKKGLESLSIDDFYNLLKETEKRLGLDE